MYKYTKWLPTWYAHTMLAQIKEENVNTKMLNFAAIYEWIEKNSMRVTYRSQVDIFEAIYNHYIVAEGVHYSAGRISQFFRGNAALPAEMVTRYQLDDAYITSLMDAVEALLAIDFADAPAALANLAQMIEEDDTISDIQKNNLLYRVNIEGGDASAAWATDVIRFAMLPRRDIRSKIA